MSDVERLREDVRYLASQPRHRSVPGSLERARSYCSQQLTQIGWTVTEQRFTLPNRLRMRDTGKPGSAVPMHFTGRLDGVNLIATPHHATRAATTLVLAHLDTVRCSPGADDNASGVAVALQMARLLGTGCPNIALAIVDLEELGQLGSRHLAEALPPPELVVCLESVGYFDDAPETQSVPAGFGTLFPTLTRAISQRARRADFLVAVHRADTRSFVTHWVKAADRAGLSALALHDRRWAGAGQRTTRWANPLLMDLDRSDHAPFWRRRIPAVMITGTAPLRNPAYHRATDTPETLDYPRMQALATSLTEAIQARE